MIKPNSTRNYGTRAERLSFQNPGVLDTWQESDYDTVWEWTGSAWRDLNPGRTPTGMSRNRIIAVAHATLPTSASGTALWTTGVRGIVVQSINVTAGTVPLTGNNNWAVRYAIDAPNDAAAAILLPVVPNTPNASADIGQVGSFNVNPVIVPDTEAAGDARVVWLTIPPVYIDVTDPINRLDFAHNIGAGITIELMIQALEEA